ncbi:MAG: hypothetical protein Kow0037_02190 [Calditrichia bacterium]
MTETAPTGSKKSSHRQLFWWITIVIPFLFLFTMELLLRIFGYGDDYPLLLSDRKNGVDVWKVNRKVAHRYFNLPEKMIPEASEEIVLKEKKPNSLRIVCVGGSTTAGFPFEINATFPFQLQYRLRDALWNNYVEVVNLGISAVNSYTVLDLMPEILELEPDAIIVYMGHNEFYGAFGVGSSQNFSHHRQAILWYLKIRRFRTYQLMESIVHSLQGKLFNRKPVSDGSLMKIVAAKTRIPINSPDYYVAAHNLQDNLSDIIKLAKEENVPVLLSTLVCNLKDQPPFQAHFSSVTDSLKIRELSARLDEARTLLAEENPDSAKNILMKINRQDSTNAEVSYLLGKIYLQKGLLDSASHWFGKARDLDELRFRAPSAFNEILIQLARENDLPLVDLEKVFRMAVPDGVPGKELFLEHLHPNFDGYRLMAQAYFEALKTLQIVNPPEPIGWRDSLLTNLRVRRILRDYRKTAAGVTELDLEFGLVRNFYLTRRWPFPEQPINWAEYLPIGNEQTKKLALEHYQKKLYWETVHYRMAEYYLSQNQPEEAIEAFLAVYLVMPDNYFPAMKIADTFVLQGNLHQAERWYKKAINLKTDDPFLLSKYGNVLIGQNKFSAAERSFINVFKVDEKSKMLNPDQQATARYMLALAQANQKKWDAALKNLDMSLSLKPNMPEALSLKTKIKNYLKSGKH